MVSDLSNVVHVTSWLSRQGGGIPPVIWSLADQMQSKGVTCQIAGWRDPWLGQDIPSSLSVISGAVRGPLGFGYSHELREQVRSWIDRKSVVHVHGLWTYPGIMARRSSWRARCPRVVSPHGMLEPWALRNSRWKKRLASWLFERQNLNSAHCLHALCPVEADNLRRYGLRNPIAIIPNGVQVPERNDAEARSRNAATPDYLPPGRNHLLFLSRLHPKKGLENLILTWQSLAAMFPSWHLLIAGSGDPTYEQKLKCLVREYELEARLTFCGSVHGVDKENLLLAADAFVLPSFSEGFSMAVLEAAAAGLPVVLTRECNFPELAQAGAAIEVATPPSELIVGLRQLLTLTTQGRQEMGQRGKDLVKKRYNWPAISFQMLQVYRWLLGETNPPSCVRFD